MNGKKSRELRRISKEISLRDKLDEKIVYSKIKSLSLKNKKLKV